jgi:hypothetical protein
MRLLLAVLGAKALLWAGCGQVREAELPVAPLESTDLLDRLQEYAFRVQMSKTITQIATDLAATLASGVGQSHAFKDAAARTRRELDAITDLNAFTGNGVVTPRSVEASRLLVAIRLIAQGLEHDGLAVLNLRVPESTDEMRTELKKMQDAYEASHNRIRLLENTSAPFRVMATAITIQQGSILCDALRVDHTVAQEMVHEMAMAWEPEVRQLSERFDAIVNAYRGVVEAKTPEARAPHLAVLASPVPVVRTADILTA